MTITNWTGWERDMRVESRYSLRSEYAAIEDALMTARVALADCYDVTQYPGNGSSDQDRALAKVDAALALARSLTER